MCLSCGCDEPGRPRRAIELRNPGRPEPDELVPQTTEDALALAESWIGWNSGAKMSLGSAWTPHKVMRRITDHLIDHLCQIEARVSGDHPVPDPWRGRAITLDTDWAAFTEQDLDEATARIRRLAQLLAIRLRASRDVWDAPAGEEWTIRAIAEHVSEATGTYSTRLLSAPASIGSKL
jgi:hypothetical protein